MHTTDETLPDFSGKVVLLDVSISSLYGGSGLLLESAIFQNQGGRLFIVGKVPSLKDWSWLTGVESAVAWNHVLGYQVFESVEDYAKRVKRTLRERIFG